MGLEIFTLDKISHIQKSKYYGFFFFSSYMVFKLKKRDLEVEGVLLRKGKGSLGGRGMEKGNRYERDENI